MYNFFIKWPINLIVASTPTPGEELQQGFERDCLDLTTFGTWQYPAPSLQVEARFQACNRVRPGYSVGFAPDAGRVGSNNCDRFVEVLPQNQYLRNAGIDQTVEPIMRAVFG